MKLLIRTVLATMLSAACALAQAAAAQPAAPLPSTAAPSTPAPSTPAPSKPALSTSALPTATPSAAAPSTPLFDCFHINFAWGFTLSGKFIDADGTIYIYRKKQPAWLPKAIEEDGKRYLTQADLDAKYVERTKMGSLVTSELDAHRGAIELAAAGKLVQAGPGANDAGTSSCHAYVHDAANGRFRDVDLGSDGGVSDSPQRNDAREAEALMIWLKSVGVAR